MCFFFFSSRRRHTRWTGDWSSDVCSSDLEAEVEQRDEALPASEGFGVVAVLGQQRERLAEDVRAVQAEVGRLHDLTSRRRGAVAAGREREAEHGGGVAAEQQAGVSLAQAGALDHLAGLRV